MLLLMSVWSINLAKLHNFTGLRQVADYFTEIKHNFRQSCLVWATLGNKNMKEIFIPYFIQFSRLSIVVHVRCTMYMCMPDNMSCEFVTASCTDLDVDCGKYKWMQLQFWQYIYYIELNRCDINVMQTFWYLSL